MTGEKSRRKYLWAGGIAVVVLAAAAVIWQRGKPEAARRPPPAIPVTATDAGQSDVPIYLHALGTVSALNTVAIRAQVTGQLISIDFVQGQDVHKGDVLARIDPAPFKAALDQNVAKKSEDEAQLVDAQKDLARYKTLVLKNFETQQNVDLQQAKVDQDKAAIDADQAAIEAAQTQLNFATLTAPIDGVVGFRQLDIGNIIHPNDIGPLTVLTQIKPCTVIFTLPQSDLGAVREAMLKGPVSVLAYDQNDSEQLAEGELLLIDNQIDQNTSTIRLKAQFANENERLWPGEFVRARLLVTVRKNAVTIPPVALQRGPNGLYVWAIKPDGTVEQRPVDARTVSDTTTVVASGVSAGERIVVDGQSRLDVGTRVTIRPATDPQKQADRGG